MKSCEESSRMFTNERCFLIGAPWNVEDDAAANSRAHQQTGQRGSDRRAAPC